jgi:hypothetical protein
LILNKKPINFLEVLPEPTSIPFEKMLILSKICRNYK